MRDEGFCMSMPGPSSEPGVCIVRALALPCRVDIGKPLSPANNDCFTTEALPVAYGLRKTMVSFN